MKTRFKPIEIAVRPWLNPMTSRVYARLGIWAVTEWAGWGAERGSPDDFCVTHVPTGCDASGRTTLDHAKKLMRELYKAAPRYMRNATLERGTVEEFKKRAAAARGYKTVRRVYKRWHEASR